MIDAHCHLEQPDYDRDRDEVVERARKVLVAVVTSCSHPSDLEKSFEIAGRYRGFVFLSAGIHPEYVKDVKERDIEEFMETVKKRRKEIVAVGEVGLDYHWVRDPGLRDKQAEMFRRFIEFSEEIRKPLVVHSRGAFREALEILEREGARRVVLHLFGDKNLAERVAENGFYITVGPIIERSKVHKKLVRRVPLERILLETDAPWFGFGRRNEPTSIVSVAEKISSVLGIDFSEVWRVCGESAARFFGLESVLPPEKGSDSSEV